MRCPQKRVASNGSPVFYDVSGKRWRHVLGASLVISLLLTGAIIWITPKALKPTSYGTHNQTKDFPKTLVSSGQLDNMPIIGNDQEGTFTRMDKVVVEDGVMKLVDPFSDEVFRTATDVEAEEIGNSPYILEYFGKPIDRQLVITFDDGPDPTYTPMILDVLAQEHVQATFFMIGEQVVKHPELLRRIISEGHMVGNHTMTHIDFDQQADVRNREELIGTDRVIRAAGKYATKLFRIPRGDPDHNMLAQIQAQQLDYLQVNMDIDTEDWRAKPGEDIAVPQLDGKGHVVLMHDGGGNRAKTVELLRKLIAEAKQQGYTFTTLDSMLDQKYRPVKDISPVAGDHAAYRTLQVLWVAPKVILTWLFWFGAGALTIMSALYLCLAAINYRKQKNQEWPEYDLTRLPYVSVILSAYNEGKVIEKTLHALRRSDYPTSRLEVVVVNDGSIDDTPDILNRYAREWPQLKVIHQRNSGKSQAINNGILQARSESSVIVTLDADTIFERDTIKLLVRHFIKGSHHVGSKPVGAVAGHVKVGNRRNVLTAWQSLEYISGICVSRLAEGAINAIAIVPGACSAWSRAALQQIGGLSEDTLAEDADATLQMHQLGYRILQENAAIAYTEAPESIRALSKQRLRWMFGNIQVLWKHKGMLLRPKYGMLGTVSMPYSLLSLLVPLLFMPPTVFTAITSVITGNWESVALFAAFVMGIHLLISIVAIIFAREKMWHLLIVPIYRLIYEPLRAYLLYASLMRILRGSAVGWNKLERMNSVVVKVAS